MGFNDSVRPPECTERHLRFLDRVRHSVRYPDIMYHRGPKLLRVKFGMDRVLSLFIYKYWIATYVERHRGKIQS